MGYRNYSVANGFTVDKSGNGDFISLGAALTAAASIGGNGTIFMRPGTYTENNALVAGWNITGFTDDGLTPTVTINGMCSFSSAGTVSISGIRLQTNSAYLLAVTGSTASIVNLEYCYLNCSNNTGINFTSSSSSALITITNCIGNLGTTGIAYFSHSSAGNLNLEQCTFNNTGSSSEASTCSSGSLNLSYVYSLFPITYSNSAGGTWEYSAFDTSAINSTCGIFGGGSQTVRFCRLLSGSASCLSISTTLTVDHCSISSSNTNAITGGGTIIYSDVTFVGSSSTVNTTTKAGIQTDVGTFGTWTPVLAFGGASVGITYSTQAATYQRIGKCVFFSFQVTLTSKGSSTGNATIAGFPFTAIVTTNSQYIMIPFQSGVSLTATYNYSLFAFESASTTANIYASTGSAGGGIIAVTDAMFSNTTNIAGTGMYILL